MKSLISDANIILLSGVFSKLFEFDGNKTDILFMILTYCSIDATMISARFRIEKSLIPVSVIHARIPMYGNIQKYLIDLREIAECDFCLFILTGSV